MKDVLKEQRNQKYNDYVKQVTPVHSLPLNMLKAFVTGGVICVIGQAILNYGDMLGLEKDIAASWCSLILIFVSVILTGLNIYPKLAKFGGARNAGADHWICQFGGSFCDRISERRAGFRDRMQDLYDCRTCDPVWDLLELGAGTDLLDLSGDCISNVR